MDSKVVTKRKGNNTKGITDLILFYILDRHPVVGRCILPTLPYLLNRGEVSLEHHQQPAKKNF